MTDSLAAMSLADALAQPLPVEWEPEFLAAVVWAWFRANRDTLCEATSYFVQDPYFSEMLDAAQKIGHP